MNDQLMMFDQAMSRDSTSATSLPGSESGVTPSDLPDGRIIDLSGPAHVPAQVSPQQGRVKGLRMLATSGLLGIDSSGSAALQRSLESRLRQQLDSAGSTLFKLTWKRRRTPLGRSYLERAVSEVRTGDSAFTSLPTPQTHDVTTRGNTEADHHYSPHDLSNAAMLSAVPSPCTPNGGRSMSTEKMDATGKTTDGRKHTASLEHTVKFASVPTPMAGTPAQKGYNAAGSSDYERKMEVAMGLRETVNSPKLATVATPRSEGSECTGAHRGVADTLHSQTKLATVSTPSSRDWKDTSGMSETGVDPDGSIRSRLDQLPRQAQLAASGQTATGGTGETGSIGQLAPDYSRWLMGLPKEWDDCLVTAMASFRKSRKRSSKRT